MKAGRTIDEPPPPTLPTAPVDGPSDRPFAEHAEESAEVSFRRFVAARWAALQRYAYLLTGDQQTAEDVVQMALEKCWRRWRQIRSDSPEAYVRAAVANTAASRRRRRRVPESSLDDVRYAPIAPGDHAEAHALRSGLWPALDNGHTRGSLADDTAWLKAFREQVAAGETEQESGGEFWAPPAARDVSVIYADDVGVYRVALVEGDWHWGPIAARQQVWFVASAGSSADRMEKGANGEPTNLAVNVLTPGNIEEKISSAAVVVVSATLRTVRLETPPMITSTGKALSWARTLSGTDGVYTGTVETPGIAALSIKGADFEDQYFSIDNGEAPTIASQAPSRGGAVVSGEPIQDFAAGTWRAARQGIRDGSDFRLLAVESPERPQPDGPVTAVVGLVTLPGGGRVLSAGELHPPTHHWSAVNAGRLLPAGDEDIDQLSIAWRKPGETRTTSDSGGVEFSGTVPGWTAAMGPVGTVRVQWIHQTGSVTSENAPNTIAATDHDDITSVRFLDAAGSILATTKVLEPIDQGAGVLPEVAVGASQSPKSGG